MIQEVQPKGYNNWTQYWLGNKRRERSEKLKALAVVIVMLISYCIVGYLDYAV